MKSLSGKQLAEIMNEDVYFAMPSSIIKWLNTINLNSSQRMIIERMIGFALQRPSRSDHHLQARLSLSLISEFTSIKERTVINSIQYLESVNLIEKKDVNKNGTLYQVNLSSRIKSLVKIRFKKTKQIVTASNHPTSNVDYCADNNEKRNSTEMNSGQRQQLLERLNTVKKQIDDMDINLPENFTPIMMLRGQVNFDESQFEKLTQLKSVKEKLETQIKTLPDKTSTTETKPISKKPKQGAPESRHQNYTKKELRNIRICDAKALMTRIKKINFIRSDSERMKVFKEVMWAIRFGWYRNFSGSTYHCSNHALKLIKNNDWRTPVGFSENQINGLIKYQGIA
ncbi:MAG: hypothetical protein U9N57_13505 [Pseudomonadota bacterium]|nr:hypothetical protein [Pseudomonadota bacterium]